MAAAGADLTMLAQWFESGQLRAHVSSTYEFERIQEAIDLLKGTGHSGAPSNAAFRGKLAVRIAPS